MKFRFLFIGLVLGVLSGLFWCYDGQIIGDFFRNSSALPDIADRELYEWFGWIGLPLILSALLSFIIPVLSTAQNRWSVRLTIFFSYIVAHCAVLLAALMLLIAGGPF